MAKKNKLLILKFQFIVQRYSYNEISKRFERWPNMISVLLKGFCFYMKE